MEFARFESWPNSRAPRRNATPEWKLELLLRELPLLAPETVERMLLEFLCSWSTNKPGWSSTEITECPSMSVSIIDKIIKLCLYRKSFWDAYQLSSDVTPGLGCTGFLNVPSFEIKTLQSERQLVLQYWLEKKLSIGT